LEQTFTTLRSLLLKLQGEYLALTKYFQRKGEILKRTYSPELTKYNTCCTQGIPFNTSLLIRLDAEMEEHRSARLTAQHDLLNKINPDAEKFLNFYELILEGIRNKTADHDLLLNYLAVAKELMNDGSNLLIYLTPAADLVRGAVKKFLNFPLAN